MKKFSFLFFFRLLYLFSNYEIKNIGFEPSNDFFSLESALDYVQNIKDPNYNIWLQIASVESDAFLKATKSIIVSCNCVIRFILIQTFFIDLI